MHTATSAVDVMKISSALNGGFGTIAMVDYPYPTDFVEPLPAWPVTYACEQASAAKAAHKNDPYTDLYAIAAAGTTFYNYAG